MHPAAPVLLSLNALVAGLFLLTAFGMVGMRQVLACLRLFVANGLLLALSAFLLAALLGSWELFAVGVIELVTKPVLIPWVLRRIVPDEIYARREIDQAVNIPTALLVSLGLALVAFGFTEPLLRAGGGLVGANLPIGAAVLVIGVFVATVRREAVPLLLGLLTLENGDYFAGIALAPTLPLIAELAFAFDVLVMVLLFAILTKAVHEHIGTTDVGALTRLKEEGRR